MNGKSFDYDPQVDVLTVSFSDAPVEESAEIEPGIIVDYDADGNIIGVEILDASKRIVRPNVTGAAAVPVE